MASVKKRIRELAPCGVYCGACPSFDKSCKGCGSEDRSQKRISKFSCTIRSCCYDEMQLDFCIDCGLFPCRKIHKRLLDTHPGDARFRYRHEIPHVFPKLRELGPDAYLAFQTERWQCDACGSKVHFYVYACNTCGKDQMVG